MFSQPPTPYRHWIARLDPLIPLVEAHIPLIIWGEDVLCVLKRVDNSQHDFRHYVLEINLGLLLGTLCDSGGGGDNKLDDADGPNYGTSLDGSTGSDTGVGPDDGASSGDDGYDSDSDDTIWDLAGDLGEGAGLSKLPNRCVDEKGDLLPLFVNILQSVKEENRPILNREFQMAKRPSWDDAGMERLLLKMARLSKSFRLVL